MITYRQVITNLQYMQFSFDTPTQWDRNIWATIHMSIQYYWRDIKVGAFKEIALPVIMHV